VRFDDRLATILTLPADTAGGKAVVWSQLVSLLAQKGADIPHEERTVARARAVALQPDVALDRKKFVADSLAGRISDADTILLFGLDDPAVAAPILVKAKLSEDDWTNIIPLLPQTSRALLRERRDLPQPAARALGIYGAGDNVLPSLNEPIIEAREDETSIQIRDLVARIEAFKHERTAQKTAPLELPQAAVAIAFRFETDRAGILNWVDGAARGPLIGISFAEISEPRAFGVDGHAAGAFRKRAAFRNARMRVAGTGSTSGDWLISADPSFDSDDGRFRGYRGLARRAETDGQATTGTVAPFGNNMSADAIRQLVHELRSPLNAIRGFAEMIDGQLLGPVSHAYRHQAQHIVEDTTRLVGIVDDIDIAARIEMKANPTVSDDRTDAMQMVEAALDQLDPQIIRFNINLRLSSSTDATFTSVDRQSGIRLIARMIATTIGIAESGENLTLDVAHDDRQIFIAIDQPQLIDFDIGAKIIALSSALQSRCSNPPALGLDFALRLIKQMADAIGGQFKTDARKFVLILPQAHNNEKKIIESG
jgi:signal transduction histidine kinase